MKLWNIFSVSLTTDKLNKNKPYYKFVYTKNNQMEGIKLEMVLMLFLILVTVSNDAWFKRICQRI